MTFNLVESGQCFLRLGLHSRQPRTLQPMDGNRARILQQETTSNMIRHLHCHGAHSLSSYVELMHQATKIRSIRYINLPTLRVNLGVCRQHQHRFGTSSQVDSPSPSTTRWHFNWVPAVSSPPSAVFTLELPLRVTSVLALENLAGTPARHLLHIIPSARVTAVVYLRIAHIPPCKH